MRPDAPTSNVQNLRLRDDEGAARVAIGWLAQRHRKGWHNALGELLRMWQPDSSEDLMDLDDDSTTMISTNASEWLLARGQMHARGGLREINGYVLGREGPFFTPGQRAWLAQLRHRPLRLYRATDVRPGEGMTLVDELDQQAPPQIVRENSGIEMAHPGLLLAVRIMQVGVHTGGADGHLELSGALYPFAKLREPQVLYRVRRAREGAAMLQLHPENVRDFLELEIAGAWLEQWFTPVPIPQIHDPENGS